MSPEHSSYLVRTGRGALLAASVSVLGGCASMVGPDPRDPLEPMNRQVMRFNEGVDAVVLKPSATFYQEKVPAVVRTGVSNFFNNIGDVWSAVNSVLQFKFQAAADNIGRVQLNTLFGLGGIFDLASDVNIERHREDFGQTLGHWGVPSGPFVVLPLLGPSTVRDTVALPVDRRGNLVHYVDPKSARLGMDALRVVDTRADLLRASSVLDGAALDKYSFVRDAYLQRRRAETFEANGDDPNAGADEPMDADEPAPDPGAATTR